MTSTPALIVCMGVSGCGKSTYGQLLADRFDLEFIEADTYHSESNKMRMAAGIPLTDEDREPWMAAVCKVLRDSRDRSRSCVLAHSALKQAHRERIRHLGFRTMFLHLDGSRDLIARRLSSRENHYMRANMLDSQLDAMDRTDNELDIVSIDIDSDEAQVTESMSRLVDRFLPTGVCA